MIRIKFKDVRPGGPPDRDEQPAAFEISWDNDVIGRLTIKRETDGKFAEMYAYDYRLYSPPLDFVLRSSGWEPTRERVMHVVREAILNRIDLDA